MDQEELLGPSRTQLIDGEGVGLFEEGRKIILLEKVEE